MRKKEIDKIVDNLKKQWIKDFGSLRNEQLFCGYTLAGFVEIGLIEYFKQLKPKK